MRLRLKLRLTGSEYMTANYNYPLSSAIYSLLKFGSPGFSSFLHDIGYHLDGKKYKLFTFALRFENILFGDNRIKLLDDNAYLYISSPLIDDFIQNLVLGTFEKQQIEISGSGNNTRFIITQVESLPFPFLSEETAFTLLSPLVLSTKHEHNGSLKQYYLRPDDTSDINRILSNNLKNKYKLVHGTESDASGITLEWDKDYIKRKKRVTKKITINENGINPIEVIGIQAPFTISGNPELIKTGYECGFGEKNSMGFGMADTD